MARCRRTYRVSATERHVSVVSCCVCVSVCLLLLLVRGLELAHEQYAQGVRARPSSLTGRGAPITRVLYTSLPCHTARALHSPLWSYESFKYNERGYLYILSPRPRRDLPRGRDAGKGGQPCVREHAKLLPLANRDVRTHPRRGTRAGWARGCCHACASSRRGPCARAARPLLLLLLLCCGCRAWWFHPKRRRLLLHRLNQVSYPVRLH